MGDKVYPPPDHFPPGIDCYACTPGTFQSGHWPSVLWATFTGITTCPGYAPVPNNHPFRIYQSPGACTYSGRESYAGSSWYVSLDLTHSTPRSRSTAIVSQLYLYCEGPIMGTYFFGTEDMCSLTFPTNLLSCLADAGQGGSALLELTPTPLTSYLCGQCHFLPWQNTRSEHQLVAMDHSVVRLANKADHSRALFYIDREDIPAL